MITAIRAGKTYCYKGEYVTVIRQDKKGPRGWTLPRVFYTGHTGEVQSTVSQWFRQDATVPENT
jgi:hypothetical protein